jgi:hypothetical protein
VALAIQLAGVLHRGRGHDRAHTEIMCPWCVVGHQRLDKVLAEHFADLPLRIS